MLHTRSMFAKYFSSVACLLLGLLLPTLPAEAQRRLRYADWQLVFEDDFDTYRDVADMAARSPWQFTPDNYRTLVGNQYEDQYYDQRNATLRDGNLYLTARPLAEPLAYNFTLDGRDTTKLLHYESAWITLKPDFPTNPALGDTARWEGNRGFQYGLFEIRCRFGGGAGTWPAFWLTSGPTEIDVFEGDDNRKFSNNLHYPSKGPFQRQQAEYEMPSSNDLAADFHIFSVVWSAQEVTYYLDRKRLRTVPASHIPTYPAPANIIANQAVVSYADLANWPLDAAGNRYSSLIIDYIKVYKFRPGR
ncbi:glycoside hydrolase family 16 protein [Hymenobacter amundsenii]|nr:glycoside hydrolase family 16 protein [Hymenobacter amundsenii]